MFGAYYLKFILVVSIAVAAITAIFFYLVADNASHRFLETEKAFLYRHAQVLKRLAKIELDKFPKNLENFATNDLSYAFSKGEYSYAVFTADFLKDEVLTVLDYDVFLWLDKQGIPLFARERGADGSFSPLSPALEYGIINYTDLVGKDWDTVHGFAVINGMPCMAVSLPVMPVTLEDGVETHPTGRIIAAKHVTNKFGANEIKLLGFDLGYTAYELDSLAEAAEEDMFVRELDGNIQVGVLARGIKGEPSFALFTFFPVESRRITEAFERVYKYFPIFLGIFCAVILAGAITYFAAYPVKDLLKEAETLSQKPMEFSGPKPFEALAERINASRLELENEFSSNLKRRFYVSLNGIKGAAELLLNSGLSKRQERYALCIKSAVKSLNSTVRGESEGAEEEGDILNFTDFHLEQLLSNLAAAFSEKHPKEQILLNYPPNYPYFYHGDPAKIRFIAAALLGSALKHSSRAPVLLDFSSEGETVKLEAVLKAFNMSEESIFEDESLLKAKEYLEIMQGDIRVESAAEESAFVVTLPLEALKRTEYKKLNMAVALLASENYSRFLKKKCEFWGIQTFASANIERVLEEISSGIIPYKYLLVELSAEKTKTLKDLEAAKIPLIALYGGAKWDMEGYKALSKYAANRDFYKLLSEG